MTMRKIRTGNLNPAEKIEGMEVPMWNGGHPKASGWLQRLPLRSMLQQPEHND